MRRPAPAEAEVEPSAGVDELVPSQLDVVEAQLARQEEAMTGRLANSSTRAAVLIGASGVLGGTELVTSSGNPWISGSSLALYLAAAVCGLIAMRSRLTDQPKLAKIIAEFSTAKTISLRRTVLASRLRSHETSRVQLNQRHGWLVGGFVALLLAWAGSGAGTVYGLAHLSPPDPTDIHIQEVPNDHH